MGIDRVTHELDQSKARLTTPGDTLLQVFTQNQTKSSIGLNTSVQGSLNPRLTGSLTLGFDHYALPISQFFTSSALNTAGTIQTVPGTSILASQTRTTNTGYFAQAQFGFHDVLFLTAGLRAEDNTEFGDSLGTPVSPRAGISYVHQIGGATLKLRGSYGRAIRAPGPGRKLAAVSGSGVTLENLALGPERQKGWDSGIDAVFGPRASLSVSYYDQTADNLIDFVLVQATPVRTSQYQNIGRVKNTGVEVEGTLYFGPVQLRAQYGYTRSHIDQLAPNYAGDLRVGDQSLYTPKHTAGASFAFTPFRGTTVGGGLTYVGSWSGFDWLAFYSCFGQTGPCRPTSRDYIIEYPGLTKVNVSVSQQITRMLSGFISIDNLTNNEEYEVWNAVPVMGRISTIGLRFQY